MNIKVCNFRSSDFASEFIDSVTNTGFAVLTKHGVDHGLIRDVQSAWRMFFLDKQAYKNKFINAEDGNLGYKAFGSEKAVGAKVSDLKEFYHWQPGKLLPGDVADATRSIFYQLEDVSSQILKVIDDLHEGTTKYREACEESNNTLLRTIYYPALNFNPQPGAVRAAAHEDINFITLLVAASAPGLQVLDKEGNWHDVPHEENSIVVNIGDMLQLASNGLFKSTTHRVVNPHDSSSDRVSMPLFVHPHGNTILAPGFTAQEYLNERIAKIYQKV